MLVEINDHDARFRSATPDAAWVPGQIQVRFREAVAPSFLNVSPSLHVGGPADVTSANADLENIFRNNFLLRAERTFDQVPLGLFSTLPQETFTVLPSNERQRFLTLHFPESTDVLALAKDLKQLAPIARALPVPRLAPAATPLNEEHFNEQWYHNRCGMPDAWNKATGEGVVVAAIDWGFDLEHDDLPQGRVELTFNSKTKTEDVTHAAAGELLAHGTAVLGLIGAADNGPGIVGFAFNAAMWAIQAADNRLTSTPEDWAKAIKFVCDQPSEGRHKVIVLEAQTSSLRNVELEDKINQAIKSAIDKKVVVCVPAGNRAGGDADLDDLDQKIPETGSILVGASQFHQTENRRAFQSQRGARITIFAPGDEQKDFTCAIGPKNAYRPGFGGTSGAVAKVGGAVALMLEANSDLTHADVRRILREQGTKMADAATEPENVFLDVAAAVSEAERLKNNS